MGCRLFRQMLRECRGKAGQPGSFPAKHAPDVSHLTGTVKASERRGVVYAWRKGAEPAILTGLKSQAGADVKTKRGFPVAETQAHATEASDHPSKRDILYIGTASFAAAGLARGVVWPLIHQMNPAENVKALASIEVDVSAVPEGQQVKVLWQGKAVFIRHRTAEDIATATADDNAADIKDKELYLDAERVVDGAGVARPEWLVLLGVCTHLGCVPLSDKGEYAGWFCPCHGSHYDKSGRIRKGPAPKNLEIPPYVFLDDSTVKIG